MRSLRKMVCILAVTLALPMVVGMAYAQWDRAVLEPLTSGPDNDALGRRALEIDDSGTLHAIYSRGLGSSHDIYYVSKPPGGIWSAPEPLGSPDSAPGIWCLAVRKETGEPYVTFFRGFDLTLGIRRATGWEFHTLATPPDFPPGKMAVTVDSDGYAHVAMVVRRENPLVWQIAYGYWDGSPDFHFQVLQYSLLVHYGLFTGPDIVVRPDGSVAILYQQDRFEYVVQISENSSLGGTDWRSSFINLPDVILYPGSLAISPRGDLHVAFYVNIELGAANTVYYSHRRAHDRTWETPVEISGPFRGARPRIALSGKNGVHVVFEETLGPRATGRLIYAAPDRSGNWQTSVLLDDRAFTPSLVMDREGNGSILFEREVVQLEDKDIEYYGYVQPTP